MNKLHMECGAMAIIGLRSGRGNGEGTAQGRCTPGGHSGNINNWFKLARARFEGSGVENSRGLSLGNGFGKGAGYGSGSMEGRNFESTTL